MDIEAGLNSLYGHEKPDSTEYQPKSEEGDFLCSLYNQPQMDSLTPNDWKEVEQRRDDVEATDEQFIEITPINWTAVEEGLDDVEATHERIHHIVKKERPQLMYVLFAPKRPLSQVAWRVIDRLLDEERELELIAALWNTFCGSYEEFKDSSLIGADKQESRTLPWELVDKISNCEGPMLDFFWRALAIEHKQHKFVSLRVGDCPTFSTSKVIEQVIEKCKNENLSSLSFSSLYSTK